MNGSRASLASLAAGLIALLIVAVPAAAKTFKPTRFDDPVPGKCKPHDCSLREAIKAANAHDARDTIVLSEGRSSSRSRPAA